LNPNYVQDVYREDCETSHLRYLGYHLNPLHNCMWLSFPPSVDIYNPDEVDLETGLLISKPTMETDQTWPQIETCRCNLCVPADTGKNWGHSYAKLKRIKVNDLESLDSCFRVDYCSNQHNHFLPFTSQLETLDTSEVERVDRDVLSTLGYNNQESNTIPLKRQPESLDHWEESGRKALRLAP
jgi:hypothetical protein